MKKIASLVLFFIFSAQALYPQALFKKPVKDVFGSRVFVENKGQFDLKLSGKEKIRFAYESGAEQVYFTALGPSHKLIRRFSLSEEEKERAERGKKVKARKEEVHLVHLRWLNANPSPQIQTEDKQNHYFSYGDRQFNSAAYKKIIYKNVYEHIDIEYAFSDDQEHGIKYSIILHPGADPSKIRMAYQGDVKGMRLQNGKVIIETPAGDITEHQPLSWYTDKKTFPCSFRLNDGVLSFHFPDGYNAEKGAVIDPWVTTLTTLTPDNYGFDVDFDALGNLYVYGGVNEMKLAKYDMNGNLLWTFMGVIPSINWTSQGPGNTYLGNFGVNRQNSKIYLGEGWVQITGARVVRLDAAGNYDNMVSQVLPSFECWDFGYHCYGDRMYTFGGATWNNNSGGIIDAVTGTVQLGNFTGGGMNSQDILSSTIDDQGNIFSIYASLQNTVVANKMVRINNSFNGNVWMVPSTYSSFGEAVNRNNYQGGVFLSNGFNCLAVNDNYLYYYDGFNLAVYSKATGAKLAFTTIPGQMLMAQGGIAVDDCDNIYLGGNNTIHGYHFNGTGFTALSSISLAAPSPFKYVYDIKLDRNNRNLYVSGSGFAGIYSAINSLNCGAGISFSTSCAGVNNGNAIATLTISVPNPTINYIWVGPGNNTVSAVMSSSLLSNSQTLPFGTYTLYTQVNVPCGPSFINTVNVNCCPNVSLSSSVTLSGCSYAVNSATVNVSGGGTLVPTVTWSPPPSTVGVNPLTASGLPAGTTTVVLSYGAGCTNTISFPVAAQAPPVTFSINNLSSGYSVTCSNPSVVLQALSNYTSGALNYNWTSPSINATVQTLSVTAAANFTVTVTDPLSGCFSQQTLAIGVNTISPSVTVAPLSQLINCSNTTAVTFSGTVGSPSVNIQQDWYSPFNPPPGGVPVVTSNNTLSLLSGTIPPGTYTLLATNLVNGCVSTRTVSLVSNDQWPNFSSASSTGFTLGCAPDRHNTTLTIVNPVSTQSPPATTSWTFLPPGFSGTLAPNAILNTSNNSTVTTIPGSWTLIVQDNGNFCRSSVVVPVTQNTVAPHVSAGLLTQTLTCFTPTILATGNSSTSGTSVEWMVPLPPPNNLSTHTLVIGTSSVGPPTSSTSLSYANYTVIATNTANGCRSNSVLVISQNFKPPVSSPMISQATPTAIYCIAAISPVMLTTGASTVTSGGPNAFASNPCWQGPAPQSSLCGASTYSCFVPGTYSLTVTDSYNGCKTTNTVYVNDQTQPPVIAQPQNTAAIACGSNSASLLIAITGPTNGLRYWITMYPENAAFSPSSAASFNGNYILSGTSSSSIAVSLPGQYNYIVTNTLTGCKASGVFIVTEGDLNCDFTADPLSGTAPLTVNFSALDCSGLGNVQQIWNFGNGSSAGTATSHSALYPVPGLFTVSLFAAKGDCRDTVIKTIRVEQPAKMELPNIFSPNGDGSNDVFFLKASGLTSITAKIFDRWGNKVYETSSSTGNIAWDGRDIQGKDCAEGVYFYLISATGSDGSAFEQKGNVTLLR